jgi:hypothetical protein
LVLEVSAGWASPSSRGMGVQLLGLSTPSVREEKRAGAVERSVFVPGLFTAGRGMWLVIMWNGVGTLPWSGEVEGD